MFRSMIRKGSGVSEASCLGLRPTQLDRFVTGFSNHSGRGPEFTKEADLEPDFNRSR